MLQYSTTCFSSLAQILQSSKSTIIELRDVRFAYAEDKHQPILNIPHWQVAEAESIFVYGPSGSGKSTLLNILSGVLVPNAGSVSVLGERLDQMSARKRDHFRANQVGYVFQRFNLIPYLSSTDNIKLAQYMAGKQDNTDSTEHAESLLTELNIESQEWGKPVSKLSTGQQQRVAIARALVNKPKILIADEPTSSLDQANRDAFIALLMERAKRDNFTLLFVTHDLSLKNHFQRVESITDINLREA